jgi:PEGA domain-containing protein
MGQVPFSRCASWFSMAPCRQWGNVKKEQGGRMDRLHSTLTALVLVLTLSGCATIVDGTSQPVTFNSEPNRAKILINGVQVGVTPLTIQVKRAKNTMIVAKKDGYESQQLPLQTKTNTYFWGNILFLYGSTTDYASDAMVEYSPNMYFITLDPMRKSEADRDRLSDERKVRNFIPHQSCQSGAGPRAGGERISLQPLHSACRERDSTPGDRPAIENGVGVLSGPTVVCGSGVTGICAGIRRHHEDR